MNRKLPPDTFAYYVDLGVGRSYQAVADHFGVTKQAVVKLAAREKWQERLQQIEKAQRAKAEQRATETLDDMNERHLRMLQVIQRKALEALKSLPLTTAMEAVRALDIALGKERLVRGEPSERTAVSVEDVIKREYERWMLRDGEEATALDGESSDTTAASAAADGLVSADAADAAAAANGAAPLPDAGAATDRGA